MLSKARRTLRPGPWGRQTESRGQHRETEGRKYSPSPSAPCFPSSSPSQPFQGATTYPWSPRTSNTPREKCPGRGGRGGKGESGQVSADGAEASGRRCRPGISPSEAIIIQSNINRAKRTKVPMQFNAPEMRCRTPPQWETQQSLLKPWST